MFIYLPIAEIPINALMIVAVGGAVGFLSGMFGVGGGFLMTPVLIFMGIPPAVAVATSANPLVATSITGTIEQYRRRNVDLKLGCVLLAGGVIGAFTGVQIIKTLRQTGQVDLFVSLLYVVLMSTVGTLMLVESARAVRKQRQGRSPSARRSSQHNWVHGLPFKTRFKTSKLYISVLPPAFLGGIVGLLSGIMGVGGGFVMVPALIYLLRVPTNLAIGTSLFQVIFVSAIATIFHAAFNQTVDIFLALLLMTGGVIGVHFGGLASQRLRAEELRLLLALLVLSVGVRLSVDLLASPRDAFSVTATVAS